MWKDNTSTTQHFQYNLPGGLTITLAKVTSWCGKEDQCIKWTASCFPMINQQIELEVAEDDLEVAKAVALITIKARLAKLVNSIPDA